MYRVSKIISFCYGHRLLGYPGKCRHLHGHNARVTVTLEGDQLDDQGMLTDFNDIKTDVKQWIDGNLDHTMLLYRKDPVIELLEQAGERYYVTEENPTAEHIARMIFEWTAGAGYPVVEVVVAETDSCIAGYRQ